jgi:hypothetical protein
MNKLDNLHGFGYRKVDEHARSACSCRSLRPDYCSFAPKGRLKGGCRQDCLMPHTFCQSCESCRNCGADPWSARVPLDPLFAPRIKRWCHHPRATRASSPVGTQVQGKALK